MKFLQKLLIRIIDTMLIFFASLVTGVTPKRPHELTFSPQSKVYYANHNSHGDFVLVWTALPRRWRLRVRPVAGADYWGKGPLRRFLMDRVFNGLLIDRQGHDPQAAIDAMGEALMRGESLIIFPEGTRKLDDDIVMQPFKSGIYHLARRHPGTEFIPVWLENINRVLPKGKLLPVPLLCHVNVGQPLAMREGEDKAAFLQRLRYALLELAALHAPQLLAAEPAGAAGGPAEAEAVTAEVAGAPAPAVPPVPEPSSAGGAGSGEPS